MDERKQIRISKFLSLILRHRPEKIGLKLEAGGWIRIEDLLAGCRKNGFSLTRDELETVVADNDKQRFSFDESGEKIRASQGHSAPVAIEFEKKTPPAALYHGTAEKTIERILETGLLKMRRHHVHLSADTETARKVGMRYGRPVIFEIDTRAMTAVGHEFYVSANGVWLVDAVPPEFLKLMRI